MGRVGVGDMKKSVYDPDDDGLIAVGEIEMTSSKVAVGAGLGSSSTEEDSAAVGGGLAIFGDGSDGDIETAGGGTGDATLSRDMFYDDLTVTAGDTITTAGYRIFVKGTLTNNGTIEHNGGIGAFETAGVGAVSGSLGSGGNGAKDEAGGGGGGGVVVIVAKTIVNSGGTIQANGGAGFTPIANPTSSGKTNGPNITSALGSAGGDGGGDASGGGGTGGGVTAPIAIMGGLRAPPFIITLKEIETTVVKIRGGAGGGGGEADTGDDSFGGGGGGGGGLVVLIYNSLTTGTEQASGGAGGTGWNGGENGDAGSAGTVIKISNT